MSREFLDSAMEMFTQENDSSRTNYAGTGLGLAIAKRLVDRLGGTIKIESEKGVGTAVRIKAGFKIGAKEKLAVLKPPVQKSIKGLRALLAEDNELNMEIAKFMLEKNGIIVECAYDGLEAVEKFADSQEGYYDVIFLDIKMPNMNGWDAARKIRTMDRTDAHIVPIFAVSANSFANDIINSRVSGINDHIAKPLSEDKIIAALCRAFGTDLT